MNTLWHRVIISVAAPHYFDAAPASGPSENFDAAPAPASTLLCNRLTFLKKQK
jgi:hypothetical protein